MNVRAAFLKIATRGEQSSFQGRGEKFSQEYYKQTMWALALYAAVLFYVLTPGVFLSLPPGASRMTVNLTHAVVFGVVLALTHKAVCRAIGERM